MKKFFVGVKNVYVKIPLFVKILVGLGIGILLGFTVPQQKWISFIGDCFIFILKAVAPVLVFFVISSSIGGSKKGTGSRFSLVIALYLGTTLVAALIAVGANYLFPIKTNIVPQLFVNETPNIGEIVKKLFTDAFTNPIKAIADGNYIGILFWSILLGLAFKVIKKPKVVEVFSSISDAIGLIVHWLMELSPLGVMGLVFYAVAEKGTDIFIHYGLIIALIVCIILIVLLIVNPLFYLLVSHKNPYSTLWKCLRYSGFHAFYLRSSAANIPNNLKVCDKFGVSRDFSSVSISLGSVINMNGAAIVITTYTLIACFSTNTPVEIGSAILLSIVASLAACGTSGIANGALMLLPLSCAMFGLSTEVGNAIMAIGLTLGVVVDCFETMLNSCSDAYFTIASDIASKRIQERHKLRLIKKGIIDENDKEKNNKNITRKINKKTVKNNVNKSSKNIR